MATEIKNAEDLLGDEVFMGWYLKTNEEDIAFWNERINASPEQKLEVEEAIKLLQSIRLKEKQIEAAQIDAASQKMLDTIGQSSNVRTMGARRSIWWAAAAILVVTLGFGAYQFSKNNDRGVHTNFGEIKKELLPDGSVIMLNANSDVRYAEHWGAGQDREVWIKGEVYFTVAKTPEKSRFIVHTGVFDVIVTGTQFNIVNRENRLNVLLQEGSVLLRDLTGREMAMKPGDFIEFTDARLQRRPLKDSLITAWKDRRFIFDNTPMKDVANSIGEIYDVTVTLKDDSTAAQPVSGVMPNDNLEVLLKALEATQKFTIKQEGRNIFVEERKK